MATVISEHPRLPGPGRNLPPTNPVHRGLGELPGALARALTAARRVGRLEPEDLRLPLRPLVARVLADPDTLCRELAIAPPHAYLYRRALDSSVLMGLFGRQLGFGRRVIEDLMLGGLLLDVGKLEVPVPILAKRGKLTPIERGYVYRHVSKGMAITGLYATDTSVLAQMLAGHHERLDGSGYPRGLQGTRIPLAARMAAIVDSYDAMTLDRCYASGLSPTTALRKLMALRDKHLDSALVVQFIRATGWYPTGAWLRLADGRIGMVREQVPGRALQPLVRLMSDRQGRPLPERGELWQPRHRHAIAACLPPGDPAVRALAAGPSTASQPAA